MRHRTTVHFAALLILSIATHAYAQGQTTSTSAGTQNNPAPAAQPATAPASPANLTAKPSPQLATSAAAQVSQTTVNVSCTVGKPPRNFSCGPERVLVDIDPSPKVCWACLLKLPPTE